MSMADFIESMADAGAPIEAIILAVRTLEGREAEIESRRAKDAERKRRQRDRERDSHADVTGQSTDSHGDTPLPPLKDPQTPKTTPPAPMPEGADAPARVSAHEAWPPIWEAYTDAIAQTFGQERRPGWPHGTDRVTVLRWLDAGADPVLILDVSRGQLARMAERKRGPPRAMSCFEDDITAAIAASRKPVEVTKNARPSPPHRGARQYGSGYTQDDLRRSILAGLTGDVDAGGTPSVGD